VTPSPTRILLVRHGQSEWNANGRWQGQADPPLTELGRAQAREAARWLASVDAIWTSDLSRAAESAAIISEALGVGPPVADDDLRERDAGEWTGLTRAQIEQQYPGVLTNGQRPPGWESDAELEARARRVMTRIGDTEPGGDVLVITHAGLIRLVERRLGTDSPPLANAEGRWFIADGNNLHAGDRLLLGDPAVTTVPGQI